MTDSNDAINPEYAGPPADSPPPAPQATLLPPFPAAEDIYWLKLSVDANGVGTLSWGETGTECPEP